MHCGLQYPSRQENNAESQMGSWQVHLHHNLKTWLHLQALLLHVPWLPHRNGTALRVPREEIICWSSWTYSNPWFNADTCTLFSILRRETPLLISICKSISCQAFLRIAQICTLHFCYRLKVELDIHHPECEYWCLIFNVTQCACIQSKFEYWRHMLNINCACICCSYNVSLSPLQ